MRSELPNPFGTSLIDLLVGALAIVALLWVLAAPNSGYSGSGEEARASGMITIEQFGAAHFTAITLEQPGRFKRRFALDYRKSNSPPFMQMSTSEWLPNAIVVEEFTDIDTNKPGYYKRATYQVTPHGLEIPIEITLRATGATGGFSKGIHIIVENLGALPLIAKVEIRPCCDDKQPHYLRTMIRSGNGKREEFSFWHEAGKLEQVLSNGITLDSGPSEAAKKDDWIEAFANQVHSGEKVRLRSFHVADTQRFYSGSSDFPSCTSHWDVKKEYLTVRFENDGDISVRTSKTNEDLNSLAQQEPNYSQFFADFPDLLATYPNRVRNP